MGLKELCASLGQTVQGTPRVEVEGERLVIERHKGVRAYSTTCIRVDCPGGEVCIEGEGLTLEALSRAEVSVHGAVARVSWKDSGG
nr:YabP/YqfC family sporulation protein [uncultured Butyricicoccus sp.]